MESASTTDVRVVSVKSCVLYDPTGEIRHTHTVVTLEGGQETSAVDLVERTMALAADRGLDTERLQALHIDPTALKASAQLRVDPDTRSLIETGTAPDSGS